MKFTLKNKEIELSQEELTEIIKLNSKGKKEEKKFQIKSVFWKVLFTSTKYDNIKEVLTEAISTGADLREADLTGADLREADLTGANLTGANLREADLTEADLREADLTRANLREADLTRADLREANFTGADLMDCKFYGKWGTQRLTKEQVPIFLQALWFIIED